MNEVMVVRLQAREEGRARRTYGYAAASSEERNDEDHRKDEFKGGSSSKGTRWMPRHRPAMKDVASCDKPGGAAREH